MTSSHPEIREDLFLTNILSHRIRIFYALAETRDYATVQNQFDLTKQAVRWHLTTLQHSLTDDKTSLPLFTHTSGQHSIELTEIGQRLKERLDPIVRSIKNFSEEIKDMTKAPEGSIVISAFPSATLLYIPKLLSKIKQKNLRLDIKMHEHSTSEILSMLQEEKADLGIVRLDPSIKDRRLDDFETKSIYQDHVRVVLNKTHHLAANVDISLEEIANEPLVLESTGAVRDMLTKRFEELNIHPNIVCEGAEVHTAVQMVYDDIGITFVSKRSLRLFSHMSDRIVARKIRGTPIVAMTAVAWKKSRYLSQAMCTVKELIHEIEEENHPHGQNGNGP